MSPAVLGSALGAAAVTVGRGAMAAAGNGLSFASELLRAASGSSLTAEEQGPPAANNVTAITQQIDALRERIRQALAAAGIALSQPVELISNGGGGISVTGNHPQQAAIEAALSGDLLLERDFNQLAGEYSDFISQNDVGDMPPVLQIVVDAEKGFATFS